MSSSSSPFSDNSHCGTSSHSTPQLHPFNNIHYRDDGHGPPASSHSLDYATSPFQRNDLTPDASGSSSHLHRAGGKYGAQYPYAMTESSRDMRNGWQVPMLNPTLHRGDAVIGAHHPQSPAYMNSPSVASVNDQVQEFTGRICVEDSKGTLGPAHDGGPGVFPDGDLYHQGLGNGHPSRSASTSSAMHPTAPTSMTSSLAPLTFSDRPQDSGGGFVYRHPQSPQFIPQGDPLANQLTDNRYRVPGRDINADHPMLSSSNEADTQDPNEDDHLDMDNLRTKTHQSNISSRSPSPARPSISCTVAVIKAQTFGALRRTRSSAKKSTEAARITLNVLQSRGIGLRDSDMTSKQSFAADGGHHNTNTP